MPRRTSKEQQATWHRESQAGASIAQLARQNHKDPRTIQRAIEEAERVGIAKQARTDLLKEGLRRHQEELLAHLQGAAAAVGPLPPALNLNFPGVPPPKQLVMPEWTAHYRQPEGSYHELRLEAEGGFQWRLILEHLGRDPALRALAYWKRAVLAELNQRLLLRDYVGEYVGKELGLRTSEDIRDPGTIRTSALWQVYLAVVSLLLGEGEMSPLVVEPGEDGEFFINGASGGRFPLADSDFGGLARLPEALASQPPAAALRQSQQDVDRCAVHARESFEEIVMSFYLPRACRSCRRFGA